MAFVSATASGAGRGEEENEEAKEEEEGVAPLLKSRDPQLAGKDIILFWIPHLDRG